MGRFFGHGHVYAFLPESEGAVSIRAVLMIPSRGRRFTLTLGARDQDLASALVKIGAETNRVLGDVIFTILRSQRQSVDNNALLLELQALANDNRTNLSFEIRSALRKDAAVFNFAFKPWTLPFNGPDVPPPTHKKRRLSGPRPQGHYSFSIGTDAPLDKPSPQNHKG